MDLEGTRPRSIDTIYQPDLFSLPETGGPGGGGGVSWGPAFSPAIFVTLIEAIIAAIMIGDGNDGGGNGNEPPNDGSSFGDDGGPTPGPTSLPTGDNFLTQGTSRAPRRGEPNTIYEQIDENGNVRSRTYYDENGYPFAREDFDHSHGGMQPHEHKRTFNSDGQPITPETIDPIDPENQ